MSAVPDGRARLPLFARFDLFAYKRLSDVAVAEFFRTSALGATVSVCGFLLIFAVFCFETLAFLSSTSSSSVVMSAAGDAASTMRVHLNVSFPHVYCSYLHLSVTDAAGRRSVGAAANILKYRMAEQDGEAVLTAATVAKLQTHGGPVLDAATVAADTAPAFPSYDDTTHSQALRTPDFEPFVRGHDLVVVAYMAPWCRWSQALLPVWEGVAEVIKNVESVRLARVDCTDPLAVQLCWQSHIAAFPTIVVYKRGAHSHFAYHGERTREALLSLLVRAQRDDDFVTDGEHVSHDGQGDRAEHEAAAARQIAAMHAAGVDDPRTDPANPGEAWELVEAIHAAGLAAPGDAARAALQLLGIGDKGEGAGAPGSESGECSANITAAQAAAAASVISALKANTEASGHHAHELSAKKEGCRVVGSVDVRRIPGRITLFLRPAAVTLAHADTRPGQPMTRVDSNTADAVPRVNLSHVIHDLWFGTRLTSYQLSRLPPSVTADLHRLAGSVHNAPAAGPDSVEATSGTALGPTSYTHVLRVVDSRFAFATGHTVDTQQYSAFTHPHPASDGLPSLNFEYDLSPLAIIHEEKRRPLYSYLTSLAALVGGSVTVLSLLDSVLHAAAGPVMAHMAAKKHALGKQT